MGWISLTTSTSESTIGPSRIIGRSVSRIAAESGATTFGMGSAYVTACEKADVRPADELDLSALRSVIPTGSPLPPNGSMSNRMRITMSPA